MTTQRDIDDAFDVRVEPWGPDLPGCRGDCQQGRRPCLRSEDCLPDSMPFTRKSLLAIVAASLLGWVVIFLVVALVARMM